MNIMKRIFVPLFIIVALLIVFSAGWRERFAKAVDSAAEATGMRQLTDAGKRQPDPGAANHRNEPTSSSTDSASPRTKESENERRP
ncbi:hypothetical protein [Noviherbaspirillum sp. ST9]|uniref:hypothetical protein n=1 Tax=Noviherbaspirillum sp. ST9 TaxID=3401606 RepID=UPI003B5877DA